MVNRRREDTVAPTELVGVRDACRRAGMTLSDLAGKMGYSVPQVSRIVGGRAPVTAEFRRRAAAALEVDQADLFQGRLFAKI